MAFFRPAVSIALTAFCGLQAGCLLDSIAFESGSTGTSNTGGGGSGGQSTSMSNGGSSGNTQTTSGSGANSGTTSSTIDNTAGHCIDASMCPASQNPCMVPQCDEGLCTFATVLDGNKCGDPEGDCFGDKVCKGGVCTSQPLAGGMVIGNGEDGDCMQVTCDGTGNPKLVPNDGDDPDDTYCAEKTCSGGTVKSTPIHEGWYCFGFTSKCCNGKCCDKYLCQACIY